MSAAPSINERAWAVDLISEINRLVRVRNRRIQSAGGERGISARGKGNILFPDVLLFGDPSHNAVLYRVEGGQREVMRTWHCEGVKTRADVVGNKSSWVGTLSRIIDDLNDIFEQGMISCSKPLPEHLNTVIGAILQDQSGTLATAVEAVERKSRADRTDISLWWRGAKFEHGNPGENLAKDI